MTYVVTKLEGLEPDKSYTHRRVVDLRVGAIYETRDGTLWALMAKHEARNGIFMCLTDHDVSFQLLECLVCRDSKRSFRVVIQSSDQGT